MSGGRMGAPFLVLRGLDCIRVLELKLEYDTLFASTHEDKYKRRSDFMLQLVPFVIDSFPQTEEEANQVKQRVRSMVEQQIL